MNKCWLQLTCSSSWWTLQCSQSSYFEACRAASSYILWGNGVLRTAAFGNPLQSHWITKLFIANHAKILGHFPKEITSPTLLYRHGWAKEIAQAFRSRVGHELELMPLDSEHQTPACLLSLLLSCTLPCWEWCRGSCAVQGLKVPPSQTPAS